MANVINVNKQIGLGQVPELATQIDDIYGQSAATGIAAAGTTLATGTVLTKSVNNVTSVGSNTGVVLPLPTVGAGGVITVRNGGVNDLKVYPPTSTSTINGGSAGAPITLQSADAHIGIFRLVSLTGTTSVWIASDTVSAI